MKNDNKNYNLDNFKNYDIETKKQILIDILVELGTRANTKDKTKNKTKNNTLKRQI